MSQHLDGAVACAAWAIDRKLLSVDQLQQPPLPTSAGGGQPMLPAVQHFLALLSADGAADAAERGAATQVSTAPSRFSVCIVFYDVHTAAALPAEVSRRSGLHTRFC